MCVTLYPAKLTDTIVMSYDLFLPLRGKIRVMGYQNTVQNLYTEPMRSDFGWHLPPSKPTPRGNAMVLVLDTVDPVSQENIIPTDKTPHVLEDMMKYAKPSESDYRLGRSMSKSAEAIQIFDVGIYTVVLAQKATTEQILKALDLVSLAKRPDIGPEWVDFYRTEYLDLALPFCCFNNAEAAKATPMMWWYKPVRPDLMFLPGLDAHTGSLPVMNEMVHRDTFLVLASDEMVGGSEVTYRDHNTAEIIDFLPKRVIGVQADMLTPNGDWIINRDDVINADLSSLKVVPPPGDNLVR